MNINRQELINDLQARVERTTEVVRKFKSYSLDDLNFKHDKDRWSILECIEHLNLYGDYYLPELERRILTANKDENAVVFSSGWLGNYFANLMQAKNGKIVKMKTPADKNPNGSALTITTLERFLKQQDYLKLLLDQSRTLNLTTTKVPISISKIIRLRLGDTFRFLVFHIERHVHQAQNVVMDKSRIEKG